MTSFGGQRLSSDEMLSSEDDLPDFCNESRCPDFDGRTSTARLPQILFGVYLRRMNPPLSSDSLNTVNPCGVEKVSGRLVVLPMTLGLGAKVSRFGKKTLR